MRRVLLSVLLSTILIFFFFGCGHQEPIKVGFITDLSSRNSQLGIQGRSGIVMAAGEINDSGGIKGRLIELIILDHKGDPVICRDAVHELLDMEVDVIFGPLVSGMVSTIVESTNGKGVLVISPTASTDDFTGIDDHFLRAVNSAAIQGQLLAELIKSKAEETVSVIIDERNYAYSGAVSQAFVENLEDSEKRLLDILSFSNKEQFPDIIKRIEVNRPEALLFVTAGIDAATLIQQYAKENSLPQLYGSSWIRASRIEEYGGRHVNGLITIDSFENKEKTQRELDFFREFEIEFGIIPTTPAINSYDILKYFALAANDSRSFDWEDLKAAMLDIVSYEGVSSTFHLNRFGDAVRQYNFFKIRNGEYRFYE